MRSDKSETVVRWTAPEDRPGLRAVLGSVGWIEPPVQHRVWQEADAEWQASRYLREITTEVEGVIAARVALEAYRQPFAELCGLSVRPDYRQRGLGRTLTRACEQEASRRSFPFLFLQTDLHNHAGHSLYSRMGFLPTARAGMLRMVKFLDYPLFNDFQHAHPLSQYTCLPVPERDRTWRLQWRDYVSDDCLSLDLVGGSSIFDSDGVGPALSRCSLREGQGARGLTLELYAEEVRDIAPGYHVELTVLVRNEGKRMESGRFQTALPPGISLSGPATNLKQTFVWQVAPGEEIVQPFVVQVDPGFDTNALWHLNYRSLPVSVETYWEGHRALLSASLPMAVPPPDEV